MIVRLLDLLVAGIGSVVSAPLVAVLALAVRLETPGDPIYRQVRIGRDGRPCEIYKLRTMVSGAEFTGAGLAIAEGDARITRVGAFLRRTSLDELPQLFNVLLGHMSLVGPRPQVAAEVAEYDEVMARRLHVKPGMTGLWQVSGRSDLSVPDAIRLDAYYVENWSMLRDLTILFRTPLAVLGSRGAY
jgi:lipopolysaccharide/colanic/teichoic acid biosynthesis glycosyltransferase